MVPNHQRSRSLRLGHLVRGFIMMSARLSHTLVSAV
jgi:hypothetical protein